MEIILPRLSSELTRCYNLKKVIKTAAAGGRSDNKRMRITPESSNRKSAEDIHRQQGFPLSQQTNLISKETAYRHLHVALSDSLSLTFVLSGRFKNIFIQPRTVEVGLMDTFTGRAENRLFAPLYSFACTGSSTIRHEAWWEKLSADRKCHRLLHWQTAATQGEARSADRRRDEGANRWVYLFMLGLFLWFLKKTAVIVFFLFSNDQRTACSYSSPFSVAENDQRWGKTYCKLFI